MKAIDIFTKLLHIAYIKSGALSASFSKRILNKPGIPGELVNSLSEDERNLLKNLTANDISDKKVPKSEIDLFTYYQNYDKNMIKAEKSKFDKEIFKRKTIKDIV